MESVIYEIWLQLCLGIANEHIASIRKVYPDAQKIYLADERELRISNVFTRTELNKLLPKNLEPARHIYHQCELNGYQILTIDDTAYPDTLRHIKAPPLVLYVQGTLPPPPAFSTAIVGTRTATRIGRQLAFEFSYHLTKHQGLIISGGADGIDTYAHRGALQAGGNTVCVLGCGLGFPYLMKYAPMRNEIIRHGALISEFPPGTPAASYTFPKRNRIISALSNCTVVIEAGKSSGALITAGDAVQQGKPLFTVPGSIDNEHAAGSNRLLRIGVPAVMSYEDILFWLEHTDYYQKRFTGLPSKEEIDAIRKSTVPYLKSDLFADCSGKKTIASVPTGLQHQPSFQKETASNPEEKKMAAPATKAVRAYSAEFTRQNASARPSAARKPYPTQRKNRAAIIEDEKPTYIPPFRKYSAEKPAASPAESDTSSDFSQKTGNSSDNISIINEKADKNTTKQEKTDNFSSDLLTENAKSVYDTISGTPVEAEAVSLELHLPIEAVLSALTELELYGLVKSHPFGRFSRV